MSKEFKSDRLLTPATIGVLFVIRIAVGWHFLYEGLIKVFDPRWSSAGYLAGSPWLLSGFFQWLILQPTLLRIVDLLNAWGLTLIGLALFFGCLTRTASFFGVVMLAMYYIAYPPFIGYDTPAVEGSYLLVNKNLIELLVLVLFVILPKGALPSLSPLFAKIWDRLRSKQPVIEIPKEENAPAPASPFFLGRRELLSSLATLPFFGGFVLAVLKKKSYEEQQLRRFRVDAVTSATPSTIRFASLSELKGQVPHGRIGHVELSRVMCGGNLVSGFAHARDLIYVSPLLKTYFTDDKVMETLRLAEACGINTAVLRTDHHTIRILEKYWKRGGKIQWLAQTYPSAKDVTGNIQMAIDAGAIGAFVQGNIADTLIRDNNLDVLEKAISFIRQNGLIAGTAAHSLRVPMVLEEAGIEFDFYMKTFHRDDYWSAHPRENRVEFSIIGPEHPDHNQYHDNIWCLDPEETAEFMSKVKKPWIAYKVLAAGAIPPKEGLRYVFEHGADFACVGMFDFQVVENANITYELLTSEIPRRRPWCA